MEQDLIHAALAQKKELAVIVLVAGQKARSQKQNLKGNYLVLLAVLQHIIVELGSIAEIQFIAVYFDDQISVLHFIAHLADRHDIIQLNVSTGYFTRIRMLTLQLRHDGAPLIGDNNIVHAH